MSQENVDLVYRGFDAWTRHDLDEALAGSDPDVEITPGHGPGVHHLPRPLAGHAESLTSCKEHVSALSPARVEPQPDRGQGAVDAPPSIQPRSEPLLRPRPGVAADAGGSGRAARGSCGPVRIRQRARLQGTSPASGRPGGGQRRAGDARPLPAPVRAVAAALCSGSLLPKRFHGEATSGGGSSTPGRRGDL